MRLKFPTFSSWLGLSGGQLLSRNHPEATICHFIRTKDALIALITWEFTRVLGALCQELEAETNIPIFYYLMSSNEAHLSSSLARIMKKGMATHFSILAWRIPWTEEPDGLQSMGSQRLGHN